MNINKAEQKGFLNLVFVAHIPYMYLDFEEGCVQEHWLYQSVLESYIPFILSLERLKKDNVPFKINVVISPSLLDLLLDKDVQDRTLSYIEERYNFSLKELERTANSDDFVMALHYHNSYKEALDFYRDVDKNITTAFVNLREEGHITILTAPATFAYLPLYQSYEVAVRAQVRVALAYFEKLLGFKADGFWLPFCGYYPGLDTILKEEGIDYIYTSSHAILNAENPPSYGIYNPIDINGSSFCALPRNRESVDAILNTDAGYFNNHNYREYYHDVGFKLSHEYLDTILYKGNRSASGFKYSSRSCSKPYNIDEAKLQLKQDVADFMAKLKDQFNEANARNIANPLITAPYDLEFFGGWWYEGIDFWEELFREITREQEFTVTTAKDYLKRFRRFEQAELGLSSCGEVDSYNQIWLDDSNSWVLRHIYRAIEKMSDIATRFNDADGIRRHMLNQAAKEILMMMAEDWSLLLRSEASSDFAKEQIGVSLANFHKIYSSMESTANKIDTNWLLALEKDIRIFKNSINYKLFIER